LQKDVESDTSGQFKKFLSAILKADREADTGDVSSNLAKEDAEVSEWNLKEDDVLTYKLII